MLLFFSWLFRVNLESSVHTGTGQIRGVLAKSDPSSDGGVLTNHLQSLPLLAKVDPDVLPGHSQVGAAGVEAEILHFVAVIQLERLEILQFPEIPEFDTGVLPSSCQIVTWTVSYKLFHFFPINFSLTVFWEWECWDLALALVLEVGHVQLLLQVPDLHVGVTRPGPEDQTVRVELNNNFMKLNLKHSHMYVLKQMKL